MLSKGLTFSFIKTIPHSEIQICALDVSKENFIGHSNKLQYSFWFWNRQFLLKMPTQCLISNMEHIKKNSPRPPEDTAVSQTPFHASFLLQCQHPNAYWSKHRAAELTKGQTPHSACQGNSFHCTGYSEFSVHGINTAYFIMRPAFQAAAPQSSSIKALVLYFKYRLCRLPQVIWDRINRQISQLTAVC